MSEPILISPPFFINIAMLMHPQHGQLYLQCCRWLDYKAIFKRCNSLIISAISTANNNAPHNSRHGIVVISISATRDLKVNKHTLYGIPIYEVERMYK